MPWISLDERAGPPGPHGGEQPSAQSIRCDLCSWEAATRRGSLRRQDAQCPGVCGGFLLVPPCGRRCVLTYGHRGRHLCRECIGFLRVNEACHCTSSPKAPPPGTSSQAHPDHVPPKAPPPGTSSQAHPDRHIIASTSRPRPAEGTPARHIIACDRRKARSLGGGGG